MSNRFLSHDINIKKINELLSKVQMATFILLLAAIRAVSLLFDIQGKVKNIPSINLSCIMLSYYIIIFKNFIEYIGIIKSFL